MFKFIKQSWHYGNLQFLVVAGAVCGVYYLACQLVWAVQ